jgi:hypothetical protein
MLMLMEQNGIVAKENTSRHDILAERIVDCALHVEKVPLDESSLSPSEEMNYRFQ